LSCLLYRFAVRCGAVYLTHFTALPVGIGFSAIPESPIAFSKGSRRSMGPETAVLLFVLGLIIVSVGSVCFICVCLTSTPVGSLIAVAAGLLTMQALNARSRARRSDDDVELAGSGARYSLVRPHAEVLYNADGTVESVAEAYLVAPLASTAVVVADYEEDKGGRGASAPPLPPSGDTTEATTSCGDYGMFRDWWAGALFLVNVLILVYLAVSQLLNSLSSASSSSTTTKTSTEVAVDTEGTQNLSSFLVAFLALAAVATTVGGSLYLYLLVRFGEQLIRATLWISIGMLGLASVASLISGQIFGSILSAIFCALTYWYLVTCHDRIIFASAVLKAASNAVQEHHTGLMSTAVLMLFTQVLYMMVWSIAFFSVASNSFVPASSSSADASTSTSTSSKDSSETTEGEIKPLYAIALFLMSVSLYWGMQVFKNVSSSTVCGTLACWWFQPRREAPVRGSLFRACTTSFGSICLGSLIVAILTALRNLIRMIRDRVQGNNGRNGRRENGASQFAMLCLLCVGECILTQLEAMMLYFNKWAFVYNAAWGHNFRTSGVKVMELFTRRGWTAIINDDLISNALMMGNVGMALGVAACGAVIGVGFESGALGGLGDMTNASLTLGIAGFFIGLAVSIIMTNILTSAVASVFVYLAEDPMALRRNHAAVYEELISTWGAVHPCVIPLLSHSHSHHSTPSRSHPVVPPPATQALTFLHARLHCFPRRVSRHTRCNCASTMILCN